MIQLYSPAEWRSLWALYCHMNERARDDYDTRTVRRRSRPWNEQVLLSLYQQPFPVSRRAA